MENWRENLIEDPKKLEDLLRETRRIAVLGMKTEGHSGQPAFYVPAYLDEAGLEIVPVLVYYPEVTMVLGKPVYRSLAEIPGPLDMVNVFRRPSDLAGHVDDLLAKMPKSVWMQSGIRNEAVAETLARAGIKVVQDRCLMVEHRRIR